MTIYEKLNKARKALSAAGLKKSGKNKFADYDYFELGDFLPTIVALEDELKFTCVVSFDADLATLRIVDGEKPDSQITFTSPMSEANLKGMHAVQNLGAVQTYLRRYLYVNAFEIVDADPIDRTATKPEPKAPEKTNQNTQSAKPETKTAPTSKITDAQFKELAKACQAWGPEQEKQEQARLKTLYQRHGYKSARDIDEKDYAAIYREFTEYGLPEGMESEGA